MVECVVVGAVQLVEQVGGGGGRGDVRPHRHRVDQQAHHRFRAGHLGRPPRDRGAEDDVVVAGQPHQQLCPGALQHGVDGGVVRARQLAKRPAWSPRATGTISTPRRPGPTWRADQCGGVEAGEHLAPGRVGGIEVAIGQPADEPAIRPGRGQPLSVVAGEYLLQQDRQRPAVHARCGGRSAHTGAGLGRCGSEPPERPAGGRGRRPRRVRRRTPAGSVHRHRRRLRPGRDTATRPRDRPG